MIDKGREPAPLRAFAGALSLYEMEHVHLAPWSPTVEETRPFAVSRCSHDWIVLLDDDEILSPACAETFRDFVAGGRADILDVLDVPIRHHVLGRFDERAWYWPEWKPVLFHREALRFRPTVHGGTETVPGYQSFRLREGHSAHVTHLSHPDVASWLEKTNRYTSRLDRTGIEAPDGDSLVEMARAALARYGNPAADPYVQAVGVLRAIYDVVDGLKRWEVAQPDGRAAFAEIVRTAVEARRCAA